MSQNLCSHFFILISFILCRGFYAIFDFTDHLIFKLGRLRYELISKAPRFIFHNGDRSFSRGIEPRAGTTTEESPSPESGCRSQEVSGFAQACGFAVQLF